jgi:large subunit ribosomal protein L10
MTRDEKKVIIDSLTEKLKETPFFYITDASGFSVAEVNAFRRTCFEKGVEYKVYKNTLIAKALENLDADYSKLADGALKGFSGILFSKETSNLPAKVLLDFRKKQGKKEYRPVFKGAGLLQSPAKNLVSALQSGQNNLTGVLKTLAERDGN